MLTLIPIFKEHNSQVKALVGQEYAAGTLQRYHTSLKHTIDFLEWKYKINDIDIKDIDHEFITSYDFYLRSVRKCANNSAVKYIKNFKKIIRICIANGWLTKDLFLNYKAKVKEVRRDFLTQAELELIANKKFEIERLSQVRDVFLFCCFTGLSYTDVKRLSNDQVNKGIDGDLWIFTKRQKTDTRSAIPLLPAATKLMELYAHDPICASRDTILPVPSNQKMNDYLKEIAAVCGINKILTSHIARHTLQPQLR